MGPDAYYVLIDYIVQDVCNTGVALCDLDSDHGAGSSSCTACMVQ